MTSPSFDRIKIPAGFWMGLRQLKIAANDVARKAQLRSPFLTNGEGTGGWTSSVVVTSIAVGLAAVVLFILRQIFMRDPLLKGLQVSNVRRWAAYDPVEYDYCHIKHDYSADVSAER